VSSVPEWPDRPCPWCGAGTRRLLAELPARVFCDGNSTYRDDWAERLGIDRDARFPLVRCTICGFVFAGRRPPDELLRVLYDEVIDEERGRAEALGPVWVARQLGIASRILDRLAATRPGRAGRLVALDFGCGYGTLADALRLGGLEVVGVDPGRRARHHAESAGTRVVERLAEALGSAPFDVVVLNEVVEHLPEPRPALQELVGALAPGGLVWVSVPDFSEWRLAAALAALARGGEVTRELNPWEHLNYFTPQRLRECFEELGLSVVAEPARIHLADDDRPGWRSARASLRAGRGLLRWWTRGAGRRTELLAERR
jgi:2-polyprenyl-3-methyl-5-hydroxy-6-metoxy-1,4-benzoquinol methylase